MFEGLLNFIEEFNTVTLFRHINEDNDALGSQFALKYWILENYPNKNVYVLGERTGLSYYEQSDIVDDTIIEESLAIVLDCANSARVDDQRFLTAKKILSIDHHPYQDNFMDKEYRFVNYAATCEILTEFFHLENKAFSTRVATCLYRGLISDTISFKTRSTTSNTLKMASLLCEKGIDISLCNEEVFDISLNAFVVSNELKSKAIIKESGLVYCVVTFEELEKYNLTAQQVKEMVFIFQGVEEIKIWAIFTEVKPNIFNGSLRSKQKTINEIAMKYGGGGHALACGIKNLTLDQLNNCIDDLEELL